MSAGEIHLTRLIAHLEEEYSWLKDEILKAEPNLGPKDVRTRMLLGFALENIAGCPRADVYRHITDGQNDRGIDAFYFDRVNLKAFVFQSKFVDSPTTRPITEADAKSLVAGTNEVFKLSIFENGNDKLQALRGEIVEAITTPKVDLFPILVSTSDKDIPAGAATYLEDGFELSMADRDALQYQRLSDLYEIISPHGGGAGAKFDIVLNGYNMVSVPFNGYYGWITGSALAELYREQGVKLFAKNLRSGLDQTSINDDIHQTAFEDPQHFWYFNNGVTFTAESVARTLKGGAAADNVSLSISNGSIVNGAQTTSTLAKLLDVEGGAEALARLKCLVRIVEIPKADEDFSSDVTRYNNSQNAIGVKDFVSLDPFQQQLRRELDRDFALNYVIRSGEDSSDSQIPSISLQEATIALVVCGTSVENAVRAKDKISTLWRDIESPPYSTIFDRTRVTPLALFKAVQANRVVEEFLREKTKKTREGEPATDWERSLAVATHGNRLFAFYVLNGINIWREEQRVEQFEEKVREIDLDRHFDVLVEEVFKSHGPAYKAPLFKNRAKCSAIIAAIEPVERPKI